MTKTFTAPLLIALGLLAGAPFSPARASQVEAQQAITLEQALRMAVKRNPSLKVLEETNKQAELLRWRAWTMLLPVLFVDGSITRNDKEISFAMPDIEGLINASVAEAMGETPAPPGPGEASIIQELWDKSFGVTASIVLFNAQSIPLLQNASDHIDATRFQTLHQTKELLFAVTAAYYAVKSSQEALVMSRADLRTALETQRLAEVRLTIGTGVKVDLIQAQIRVAEAQKQVSNAKDAVTMAFTSLGYLIGLKPPFSINPPPKPSPPVAGLESLQRRALDDRLDLQAGRIRTIMAERDKTATWTKWIPTFDLTFNTTWTSTTGFSGENASWRIIFGARWDIFSGGQKIVELYERDSQIRMTEAQNEQLELDILQEVEKSKVEVEQSIRNVEVTSLQLSLAEENHRLVSKQYQQGLATGLELLNATTTLSQSRRALVLEELREDLAVLRLDKAMGMEIMVE